MKDRDGPKGQGVKFYMLDKEIASRADLKPTDKIVLAVITDRIGNNGHSWPGIRRIAADAGLGSSKTAERAVNHLERAGLLTVERGRGGQPNHYRLGVVKSTTRCRQKYDKGCSQNDPQGVVKSTTELDPLNYTQPTTTRKHDSSIVWNESDQRFIVTAEQLAHWTRDFPGVDVEAEVRKAGAWHAANRRWKSRYQVALARWLGRAGKPPPGQPGKGRFQPAVADFAEYDATMISFEGAGNEQRG